MDSGLPPANISLYEPNTIKRKATPPAIPTAIPKNCCAISAGSVENEPKAVSMGLDGLKPDPGASARLGVKLFGLTDIGRRSVTFLLVSRIASKRLKV